MADLHKKSIDDFGEQWTHFTDNTGYYGNIEVLQDICGPLLDISHFKQKSVIDIGAGTGRLTNLLIESGASHVYSLEPSAAFEALKVNTASNKEKITYLNLDGSEIPESINYDYAISIGVLHHIPNPIPTIKSAIKSLKSGGCFLIWVYGEEGNYAYLSLARVIRSITTKLTHDKLIFLSRLLVRPLKGYASLCNYINLPMRKYMLNHIEKLDAASTLITIYDQLNPCYSKYYKKVDALSLLDSNGLINCKIYHRHGYSWTVIGEKP